MITAALLALLVVGGAHPARMAVLTVALVTPHWFLAGAVGWAVWCTRRRALGRQEIPGAEAAFLGSVAAELEAGASLNMAVVAAADRAPGLDLHTVVRTAEAGRPAHELAELVEEALPVNGPVAAGVFGLAATTGAAGAAAFTALAVRALDAAALERERRTLTAQARTSAWLVGGFPVATILGLALLGRGPALEGPAALLSAAGLALIAMGGVTAWLMVRTT